MSFHRYFAGFDRAVMVRGGKAQDADLLRTDGNSALKRPAHHTAPSVVVGVALSGTVRPGQDITILPGTYEGFPSVRISHRLLRGGAEDVLNGLTFALTEADLDRPIEVIETAANNNGTVQTVARIVMQQQAPTEITLSAAVAAVTLDAELPLVLAELGADGTAPLAWSVTGAGDHVGIDASAGVPVLMLLSMPGEGNHALTIRAENGAGMAEAGFGLGVAQPAVRAPGHVVLSETEVTLSADADLPVVLARVSADGTQPLDWAVEQAGDWFALVETDAGMELHLVAMPAPGAQAAAIRAENEAGGARAIFDLIVTRPAVAPGPVAMSADAATVGADQELPLVLAILAAEGSDPIEWSLDAHPAFALSDEDGIQRLMLVAVPPAGEHAARIRVANAVGSASAEFVLTVSNDLVAPTAIDLSVGSAEVRTDAELPLLLAVADADGTAPLDWSLEPADGLCALEAGETGVRLMLVTMPAPGTHAMELRAANAAGSVVAEFALTVAAKPVEVLLSAASAEVVTDAALPLVLAEVATDAADLVVTGAEGAVALKDGQLVLQAMPQPGTHAIRIAVGDIGADFVLTVTAATVAPTAITLSDAAVDLFSDSPLPRLLATVAADGSAPLVWSLEGGEGCAVLEQDGDAMRLMLIAMPEPGAWPLTVRAANGAGAAQAVLALQVQQAVPPVEMPFSLSSGEARDVRRSEDGDITFALLGSDHDGEHVIPGAAIASAYPVILRMPEVTESPAGTFTVTNTGLYAFPLADPPSVFLEWDADGKGYGNGTSLMTAPHQATTEIGLTTRLVNSVSHYAGAIISQRQVVQVGTPFVPVPARFSSAQNGIARWNNVQRTAGTGLFFIRYKFDPDGADAITARDKARGAFLSYGDRLVVTKMGMNGDHTVLIYLNRPGETANLNVLVKAHVNKGDVVSAVGLVGGNSGGAKTAQVGVSVNGGAWSFSPSFTITDHMITTVGAHEIISGLRLGGRAERWIADHATHETHRAFVALDLPNVPNNLGDVISMFVKPDGRLEHPAVSRMLLDHVPLLDFRDGQNHGTLGAPDVITGVN